MYLSYITMSHRFLAFLQISIKKAHETCLSPLKNERRASLLYARDQQTILSRRKILLQSYYKMAQKQERVEISPQ